MERQTRNYLKALLQAWIAAPPGQEPVPVPLPQGMDPAAILDLLEAHNVQVALGPYLPPECHTEDFGQKTTAARHRTSFLLMELERILPAITWEDCQPVVLKGAALAPTLYREPTERWFVDLDILVPRNLVDEVCSRLEKHGYRHFKGHRDPEFYERYHFHRIMNGPQGSVLEVHWDLTAANSVYGFDVDGVFSRSRPARLGNQEFRVSAPVDQVLHGVYQNIADGYLDLRRVMDMGLLMDNLSEEDWLYLMKESQGNQMGAAFGTWLHVVKEILGKEPPKGIPEELNPSWATRRIIQGLDVSGGLLDRSAESNDGYSWLLHFLFTPNAGKQASELKKHLLPGEALYMDHGHPADQSPGFGNRVHSSLYHAKRLVISSFRAMRALIYGRPAS